MPYEGLIGNPVKFRDGPAAVIGDEIHNITTVLSRTGRCGCRVIRESEDLPANLFVIFRKRNELSIQFWGKKGKSQINYFIGLGFLFSRP